jgi:hypothetical protein
MIFDRFRKNKKNDILPESLETTAELPEDLERFRMRPPEARLPEAKPEIKMIIQFQKYLTVRL